MVKLPCNPTGNRIQLHTIGFAARHICGEQTKEIASAAGWLQDIALGKAHLGQGLVDSPDDHGRRVKGGKELALAAAYSSESSRDFSSP